MSKQNSKNKRSRLFRLDGFRCHYCQRLVSNDSATFDHRIPKSRGGTNHISNIVLSCSPCNNAKGNRTEDEFFALPYENRERLRAVHIRSGVV